MLIELAVGDTYGAGFEYAPREFIQQYNTLSSFVQHPAEESDRYIPVPKGKYTDDTQMSIAIAELLCGDEGWTPLRVAEKFVEVFKRDERQGYAGGFYSFLKSVNSGEEFLKNIRPYSDKSGAAMRAVPLGYLPTIASVMAHSQLQAKVTHNTPGGINAAVASSLLAHYFIYNLGPKCNVGRFLEHHVHGAWDRPWTKKIGSKGYMDVQAAVTTIKENDSLSDILVKIVDFGGDTDTAATIALGAGSCSKEIANDLPNHLVNCLENGVYGKTYLRKLDCMLEKKFLNF